MMILANLAKLTDQLTDQPTSCYRPNTLNCFNFKSGAIWNIHTKFQPNLLRNDDFSPLKPILTDGLTNGPMDQWTKPKCFVSKKQVTLNPYTKFQPNILKIDKVSPLRNSK